MNLPLHNGFADRRLPWHAKRHAGLWFDKFCNTWKESHSDLCKLSWIQTVTSEPVGDRDQIQEQVQRMRNLIESKHGRCFVFETISRFVTGLGRSHPVENGFAWHATLGTPYLPGSSIKGLVKSWVGQEIEGICFLDALPLRTVQLEADIMTPHYANWSENDRPGDWRSPTPIPFLTTAKGTKFIFGAVPQRKTTAHELEKLDKWLDAALSDVGAGAKTAVGYGRFKRDQPQEEKWQAERHEILEQRKEAERLHALAPLEREIRLLLNERPNRSEHETTTIFNQIRDGRWSGTDKLEAAKWLQSRMKQDKTWKESTQAKRPHKDTNHQRTKQVQAWLEEGRDD